MLRKIAGISVGLVVLSSVATAGGELPVYKRWFSPRSSGGWVKPKFELPRILHPGNLPIVRRMVGYGSENNPYYGPTYYYPSTDQYKGRNPTYYPFFLERLWPNYKTPTPDPNVGYEAINRPKITTDDYDRYMRDGRYGERQWNR